MITVRNARWSRWLIFIAYGLKGVTGDVNDNLVQVFKCTSVRFSVSRKVFRGTYDFFL